MLLFRLSFLHYLNILGMNALQPSCKSAFTKENQTM